MEDSQTGIISIGTVELIMFSFVLLLGAFTLWGNDQILMLVLGGFSLAVLFKAMFSGSYDELIAAVVCAVISGPVVFREREYNIFQPEFYVNLPQQEVTRWEILLFAFCASSIIGMAIRFLVLRLCSKLSKSRSEGSAALQTETLTSNAGEN